MRITLLSAILNIINDPVRGLGELYRSRNRANNMGEALEEYIKDAFAGTINELNDQLRLQKLQEAFSYTGNQNNPPDIIIRGGDAIEVKKIENANATLALNSSYPKAKLFADSQMITNSCRTCEEWEEKDIIYAVGVVEGNTLKKLYFVYGIDYAASANVYERIRETIQEGVQAIPDVEFAETRELGRVNRVDPLGITYLRIRGMWGIENPARTFSYILPNNTNTSFELNAIINSDKYSSFPQSERSSIKELTEKENSLGIKDVEIKIPDNPARLKLAKLITYRISNE